MKKLNVLILDDIEIVADKVKKRMARASEINLPFTNLQIIPHYLRIDHNQEQEAAKEIAVALTTNRIDILLLDRGFYDVIDPEKNPSYSTLDKSKLYGKRGDQGIMIENILEKMPKNAFDNISGVVIYTYIAEDNVDEGTQIKDAISRLLPPKFDKNAIEIVQSNLEIYKLANLKLYNPHDVQGHSEIISWGNKSEFILYGLFMGEILYHRVLSIVKFKKYGKLFLDKKARVQRNIIFLFFVLTGVNVGSSALFELFKVPLTSVGLLAVAIILALGLPLLILWLKPELLINLDD